MAVLPVDVNNSYFRMNHNMKQLKWQQTSLDQKLQQSQV